jgi:hypothetical protein
MKKCIAITAFTFFIAFSTVAQDWNDKAYQFFEIYPGYIITLSGDTTRGYVEHGNRMSSQKTCIFYKDASKRNKEKYKPSEIKGYGVADKHYRTLSFSGGLMSKPQSFVLLLKPGRISQFMYYSKKDDYQAEMMRKDETRADYDARIHTDEIVWQKLDEKPVQQQDFLLGFAKRVGKLISDYPELAAKVENKEKGYGLLNIYSIMDEYNAWWAGR